MLSWEAIKAWLWVLPYAAIAILVAFVFYYRADGAQAAAHNQVLQTQLDSVVATNAQQQQTIVALAELSKKKDEIVSDLADKVSAINQTVLDTNKAVTDLKASDPDVKSFSALPVPDSLVKLHNKPSVAARH